MKLKPEKWFIVVMVIGIGLWWFYSWQLGTTVMIIGALFQSGNFIEDIRIKINNLETRLSNLEPESKEQEHEK